MPYTSRASATITVNVGLDGDFGDAPPLGGKWTVTAADPFDETDYSQSGTGDATLTGDVVHGREYQIVFHYEDGYSVPTSSNIVADSGNPQSFDGNYETVAATTGSVTVTTQAGANWVLIGALGYNSGSRTNTQTINNLPWDTYTATFDDNLIGFTSPSPDVDVLDSPQLYLTGSYSARSTAGSFTVDVQRDGSDPGAWGDWTVTSDAPFAGDFTDTGSGDGTVQGSVYEGRDYTCTWQEEPNYSLSPTSQGLTATTGSQEFATDYTSAAAGDIYVAFSGVTGIGAHEKLTATLVYEPNGSETPIEGNTLLTAMPTGDYHVRWGWLRDYWTEYGFDSRSHPSGVGPNGPWTGPTQRLTGTNSLTFADPYTYRGVQPKTARRFGLSAVSDTYYGGGQNLSNMLGYVRRNVPANPGWPSLNPTQNSESRVQIASPPGKDGPQPFWLFWRGKGTMSVGTGDLDGSDLIDFYCNGDAAGQAGHRFILNVDQTPGDTLVNNPQNGALDKPAWGYLRATGIDGADPLRDIEIVHADYCGDGADKSFRSTDPTTGNFVTAHAKNYMGNCGLIRFLDHTNRINYPDKDFPEGRGSDWEAGPWVSGVGRTMSTGAGREANSVSSGEGHTVLQCYQQQIDMANALDVDLWICTPTWDNPALEQAIIDAIEAPYTGTAGSQGTPGSSGLRSTLKVYFEYSNETWNGGYQQTAYTQREGARKAGISPSGPASQGYQDLKNNWSEYYGGYRYTADRLVRFVQRYKSTIGASAYASRCRAILAAQSNASSWPYVREAVSDPKPPVSFDGSTNAIDHIDYWSIAYYFDYNLGNESSAPGNYESAYQSWYTDWYAELQSKWAPRAVKARAQADQNGWDVIAYEGGGGHMGANKSVASVTDDQWWYYAQRHVDSYKVAVDVYESLDPYFDLLCEFNMPATWGSQYGCWGVNEAFKPEEVAWRWHAMIDYSHMNPRT